MSSHAQCYLPFLVHLYLLVMVTSSFSPKWKGVEVGIHSPTSCDMREVSPNFLPTQPAASFPLGLVPKRGHCCLFRKCHLLMLLCSLGPCLEAALWRLLVEYKQ